jgi:UDP-N-acetylmuramoyl-tripeptide--D-alanyl-D-alanine ligase
MTALWTWDDLLAAAGARAQGTASEPVMGFSIDTRTIVPGDVFVALKDVRDGHDFVTQAFAKGATAALVSKAYVRKADDGALLRVDDPLRALEGIGHAARKRLAPSSKVIALTGSAGKTGTKEMLRACLTPYGATHAPEKSYNNHWGVPLTLARMPAETEFGVFEIGMNHAGEIAPLSKLVAPHIAIVTNVLPVHIGNFPDGEIGVANAKAEIFSGCSAGGTAVLPRDNVHYDRLEAAARAKGLEIVSFGIDARATVRADTSIPSRTTATSRSARTYAIGWARLAAIWPSIPLQSQRRSASSDCRSRHPSRRSPGQRFRPAAARA